MMCEKLNSVTIIIPVRNEEKFIRRCINSLAELEMPQGLLEPPDTLVVDNNSSDGTATIAESAGVLVVSQEAGLVGSVRNRGAWESTSDVLAFIDGDCVVFPTWLTGGLRALKDENVGIVGGQCLPNPQGTWVEKAWASSSISQHPKEVQTLPGASMIMRRKIFEKVGGFSEDLSAGEDDDICHKVSGLGLRILSLPECSVIHLGYPRTLLEVARRQVWHGGSQLDVAQSVLDRQLFLTHAFACGLASLLVTLAWPSAWTLALGTAGIGIPTLALAVKKSRGRTHPLSTLTRMIPVALFFYFGRAFGLVQNYGRLLRINIRKLLRFEP